MEIYAAWEGEYPLKRAVMQQILRNKNQTHGIPQV